jgi:hypothetical protein
MAYPQLASFPEEVRHISVQPGVLHRTAFPEGKPTVCHLHAGQLLDSGFNKGVGVVQRLGLEHCREDIGSQGWFEEQHREEPRRGLFDTAVRITRPGNANVWQFWPLARSIALLPTALSPWQNLPPQAQAPGRLPQPVPEMAGG